MMRARTYDCPRAAFTLVETLLALALSSALLLGVFSLIDSTVTYHVTGSDQALVSQRLIGLLQDLRSDIRAVQADPHWQAVPEVQATFDEQIDLASARLTSQLQLSDMEKYAEPIRLVGQSNWLVLTLGIANPRWPQDANHHQQVVWSLGGRGSITVPTHDNNGRWTNQVIPGLNSQGLIRSRIVPSNATSSRASSEFVIAADDVRFRFLSRGQWRSSWNSSSEKRLPEAVEVDLQLIGDAQRHTWVIQMSSLTPARAR